MTGRPVSRRALLRSGLLCGAATVAGCLGDGSVSTPSDTAGNPPGPFDDVSVDGGDLVVELVDNHDVSGLNLIAPDGTAFAETDVAVGARQQRIELLDIRPGLGGYDHYDPGVYELVAIQGDSETTVDVPLEPDLQIVDVGQYREGEKPSDYGRVVVTVENVGTGPTWVYEITYRDAPNHLVNDPLNGDPGVPVLTKPTTASSLILDPNSQRHYVGDTTPFVVSNQSQQTCSLDTEMTVLVGVADGSNIEYEVSVSYGGSSTSTGLTGEYTCTNVAAELTGGGSDE